MREVLKFQITDATSELYDADRTRGSRATPN